MEVGIVPNAAGSAYIEWGGNKIYAAVYGPREVHPHHMARPDRGILRVFYRMATFSVHERKRAAPGRREKEISMVMENSLSPVLFLELYPDSALELFVEVIAADGGTRCASITVAALALADAGIPMRSLVTAVAGGKADGKLILDCSGDEDKACRGVQGRQDPGECPRGQEPHGGPVRRKGDIRRPVRSSRYRHPARDGTAASPWPRLD